MNSFEQNVEPNPDQNDINDGWSKKNIAVKLFVGQIPKIWYSFHF